MSMLTRYAQVGRLYLGYVPFRWLAGLLVLTTAAFRWAMAAGYYGIADEFFSLFIVFGVWLAFIGGVMIKEQLASPRAALWPGYRSAHLAAAGAWSLIFGGVFLVWAQGLYPAVILRPEAMAAVIVLVTLATLVIVALGYLSVRRLILAAYFGVLLFSWQTFAMIIFLSERPFWLWGLGLAAVALAGGLVWRLVVLNEDCWEYADRISFVRLGRSWQTGQGLGVSRWLRRRWPGLARPVRVPRYPAGQALWRRAGHWLIFERADLGVSIGLLVLLTPLYLRGLRGWTAVQGFFLDPYHNLLVYSVAPVLLVLIIYHRNMAQWPYDLLRPVSRRAFIQDMGAVFLGTLAVLWLFFICYLIVLPVWVLDPAGLAGGRLWSYLFCTAGITALIFAWIARLGGNQRPAGVIIQGLLLVVVTQGLFMAVGQLGALGLLGLGSLCAAGAGFFLRAAYRSWLAREWE